MRICCLACRKDTGHARHPVCIAPDIPALGQLYAQLLQHTGLLRPNKPHREQNQISLQREFASDDLFEHGTTVLDNHFNLDEF